MEWCSLWSLLALDIPEDVDDSPWTQVLITLVGYFVRSIVKAEVINDNLNIENESKMISPKKNFMTLMITKIDFVHC